MNKPLVSAVMPTTKDRAGYITQAAACFLAQDYEPKELVILDDGPEPQADLLPTDPRIRYTWMEWDCWNIPQKRNWLADRAKGEVIIHFDDDDWSAPGRISDQVRRLQQFDTAFTGYHSIFFWDERTSKAWKYLAGQGQYAVGTSFCYTKAFWRKYRFNPTVTLGSDNDMVYRARDQQTVVAVDAGQLMVARIHANTSNPKFPEKAANFVPRQWEDLPAEFRRNA